MEPVGPPWSAEGQLCVSGWGLGFQPWGKERMWQGHTPQRMLTGGRSAQETSVQKHKGKSHGYSWQTGAR